MFVFGLYGAFVVISYFIAFASLTAVNADANMMMLSGMILGVVLRSLSEPIVEFANKNEEEVND